MRARNPILLIMLTLLLLSMGCGLGLRGGQQAAEATLTPRPTTDRALVAAFKTGAAEASVAPPAASPDAPGTATPAPTFTIVPLPGPMIATTTAFNVNLRQGPGTLFPAIGILKKGADLTIVGKAPGDDWLFVDTGYAQGFVATGFTSLAGSDKVPLLPNADTSGFTVIRGHVAQSGGGPLAGITFAVFQGREDAKPPETLASSLPDGSFYAYLPAGSSGTWRVSLRSVDCASPIVDKSCRYLGAFVPRVTDVTLPGSPEVEIAYYPQ